MGNTGTGNFTLGPVMAGPTVKSGRKGVKKSKGSKQVKRKVKIAERKNAKLTKIDKVFVEADKSKRERQARGRREGTVRAGQTKRPKPVSEHEEKRREEMKRGGEEEKEKKRREEKKREEKKTKETK